MSDPTKQNNEPKPWVDWKDHSNHQPSGTAGSSYESGGMEKSLFEYRDATPESISASSEFPDVGFQENPGKAWGK